MKIGVPLFHLWTLLLFLQLLPQRFSHSEGTGIHQVSHQTPFLSPRDIVTALRHISTTLRYPKAFPLPDVHHSSQYLLPDGQGCVCLSTFEAHSLPFDPWAEVSRHSILTSSCSPGSNQKAAKEHNLLLNLSSLKKMVCFKGHGCVSQTQAFFPRVVCGDAIPWDNKNFKILNFLKDVIQIITTFTVLPPVYIEIFSWYSWKYQMRKLSVYKKSLRSLSHAAMLMRLQPQGAKAQEHSVCTVYVSPHVCFQRRKQTKCFAKLLKWYDVRINSCTPLLTGI